MTKTLYYHKTDGGAEYLCTSPVEGTNEGDLSTAVIRLDGQPELIGAFENIEAERAAILDALKVAVRELEWLDKNALIKSRAGGDYIEVEGLPVLRGAILKVEGDTP